MMQILYEPSSSTAILAKQQLFKNFRCKVCEQPAHGTHFGVASCRACSAFFRRSAIHLHSRWRCKKMNNCRIFENDRYTCKQCRLKKCYEVGMLADKFQFDRDPISATKKHSFRVLSLKTDFLIPSTSILIKCDRKNEIKAFIDTNDLIRYGLNILTNVTHSNLAGKTQLEKLAIGHNELCQKSLSQDLCVKKFDKDTVLHLWQEDFNKTAQWLTYFDDFQQFPESFKITFLKTIWELRSRFERVSITANRRRLGQIANVSYAIDNRSYFDRGNIEIDVSWMSNSQFSDFQFLIDDIPSVMFDAIIKPLMDLNPSDVEISYMIAIICLQFAGRKHNGEMLEISENLQEKLANDLHKYYSEVMRFPIYSTRLAKMMGINNTVNRILLERKRKMVIAEVFDYFSVDYTHPEMFEDNC